MILTGLIGRPVTHSWSQILFNSLYERQKTDAIYISIDLMKRNLRRFVEFSRESFLGYNITAPYKIDIIPLLNGIENSAREIGSVNLVKNENGNLFGYNTDYYGFKRTIELSGLDLSNKKILIAGTGGIFRTIGYAITDAFSPSRIVVLSRDPARITKHMPSRFTGKDFEYTIREDFVDGKEFDVVINCTPLGTSPNIDIDPFEGVYLKRDVVGIDVVYNPSKTKFLSRIEKAGGMIVNGMELFLGQALETHKILFGKEADRLVLENIVQNEILGGN